MKSITNHSLHQQYPDEVKKAKRELFVQFKHSLIFCWNINNNRVVVVKDDTAKVISKFTKISGTFHTTSKEFEIRGFTLKTKQMFSEHSTPEEIENTGFTLKTHQMFSVHTTREESENGGFTLKTHQMFSN